MVAMTEVCVCVCVFVVHVTVYMFVHNVMHVVVGSLPLCALIYIMIYIIL